MSTIEKSPASKAAAKGVLETIYKPAFVRSISDPVDAARDIWSVYSIAPAMAVETRGLSFSKYVPAKNAAQLAYVNDAEAFYRYGPSIRGTNSFKTARPVRDNFFRVIDNRLFEGGKSVATFRFAHGETIMPFASMLDLPGSDKQASPSTVYTYANNSWRGNVHAKMAANIDWAVYRRGSSVLVTARYNEKPIRFSAVCKPTVKDGYFYELSVLKKCVPRS